MAADYQAALYTWLTAQSTITALVGTRIYPLLAPATAVLPYVTYQRIAEQEEAHLGGLSGLSQAVYQFDVWGATAASAYAVYRALVSAMDLYRGLQGGIPVRLFRVTSVVDGLDLPDEGQTLGEFRHTITADVWFHQPA